MGLNIEDGTGKGYQAKVNDKNMLLTMSVSNSVQQYANRVGQFYSCKITVTPSGAGKCFYYFKNTCEFDAVIRRLSTHVGTNEVIKMYINDSGNPVGGIDYIPINRNGGSANLCECVVKYGQDITELNGGSHFDSIHIPADNDTHTYRLESGVIIPKNKTFTLYAVTGNIEIDFTLTFFNCIDI